MCRQVTCLSVFICVLGGSKCPPCRVAVMKFKCVCPVLKWGGAWCVLCKVMLFLFLFICVTDLSCQISVSCWGGPSQDPWPCASPHHSRPRAVSRHALWNEGPGQPHGCVLLNDTGDCVPQIGPQATLLPPFFPGKTRPGMPFIYPPTV